MKLCWILEKITFYGIFGHQVHKLSVVWTFLDRASIVLDPTGREAEEEVMHVENTNAASVPKIVFRKGERANPVFQGLTTSASQIEGVKKKEISPSFLFVAWAHCPMSRVPLKGYNKGWKSSELTLLWNNTSCANSSFIPRDRIEPDMMYSVIYAWDPMDILC